MLTFTRLVAVALAATLSATAARSQETVKPEGKVAYKSEFGGLMVSGLLEGEMFGAKFTGKSMDSYDAAKKKYFSVWVDSMSGVPMMLEGTYDKEKKTMTLSGEGPGIDGKPT